MVRSTYTYVLMGISKSAYEEIKKNMVEAGYDHVFGEHGEINMHGIAVVPHPKFKEGDRVEDRMGHVGTVDDVTGQTVAVVWDISGCVGDEHEDNLIRPFSPPEPEKSEPSAE